MNMENCKENCVFVSICKRAFGRSRGFWCLGLVMFSFFPVSQTHFPSSNIMHIFCIIEKCMQECNNGNVAMVQCNGICT